STRPQLTDGSRVRPRSVAAWVERLVSSRRGRHRWLNQKSWPSPQGLSWAVGFTEIRPVLFPRLDQGTLRPVYPTSKGPICPYEATLSTQSKKAFPIAW